MIPNKTSIETAASALPTAAPAHFPYRDHRNMAEVMADETKCRFCGRNDGRAAWTASACLKLHGNPVDHAGSRLSNRNGSAAPSLSFHGDTNAL